MDEKEISPNEKPDEVVAKLKAWRQANPRATLTEIEEAVEAELAKIRNEWVAELAEAGEAEAPTCPQCGEAMVRNGRRKRRLKSKEGKTLQLERQQWRCLGCGTTLFPPG